jgi:hypothetical protein
MTWECYKNLECFVIWKEVKILSRRPYGNKQENFKNFMQCSQYHSGDYNCVTQRGVTGGPQATSGPRQLVTRPAKLFVNFLLVTTSSFIFFDAKDLKKYSDSHLVHCFTYECHHDIDFKTPPYNISYKGKNYQIQYVAGAN